MHEGDVEREKNPNKKGNEVSYCLLAMASRTESFRAPTSLSRSPRSGFTAVAPMCLKMNSLAS